MQEVVQVFTAILDLASQFANFVFSSWVMSLFFAGCIILFIVDLVITSSNGGEDSK